MNIEGIKTLYKHDFYSFVQFSFNILHPYEDFLPNWHIDLISHYLYMASEGKIQKLIINAPPRMLKSECVSVAWPAWILGRDPRKKILCLHSHTALGRDLNDTCFDLMSSKRYRALFPSTVIKEKKDRLNTTFGGKRQFMSINGRLTGLGADVIIIDDPISTEDVQCKETRKRLNRQFDENILQRLNNKSSGAIVLVMQRLHEDDLTAHLLAKNEGWVHLNLSAIAIEDEVWDLPYGQRYYRKKKEVLHEAREPLEQLADILRSVGGNAFAYQYLQGQYKPKFGRYGKGSLWLTPQRKGVLWDIYKDSHHPCGFYNFNESELILPKVFGVGEDPYPADMREKLTEEEWLIAIKWLPAYQEKLDREYEEKRKEINKSLDLTP